MNHESCRERLVDLAYGELARKESAEVERHLAECEPCRRERDRLAEAMGAMRRLEAPPAPERGDAVILAAARQAAEERRRDSFGRALRSFSLRIAAGTAFAALAVFVVVEVRQGLRSPVEEVARMKGGAPGEPAPSAPAPAAAPPTAAPETVESLAGERAQPRRRAEAEPPRRDRGQAEPPEKKVFKKKGGPVAQAEEDTFASPPPAGPEAAPSAKAAPSGQRRAAKSTDASGEGEAGSIGAPRPPAAAEPAQPGRAAPEAMSELADRPRSRAAAPAAPAVPMTSGARAGVAAPRERRSAKAEATSGPTTPWARAVEARHAAGELSEAQKRFEPCPGGDVRRVAWIDGAQRVLKLVRERADGALVEEWFDEEGRLREALVRVRVAGGEWTRRVRVSDRGEETQDASDTGLAPESPPPPLVRSDPGAAFFAGAGCSR